MKKKYLIIPVAGFLLVGIYLSGSKLPEGFSKIRLMKASKNFVGILNRGEYSVCYDRFSQIMKASLDLPRFKNICESILDGLGGFVRFRGFTFAPARSLGVPYVVCTVKCQYKNGSASFIIALDRSLEIGGLYIK